jgi:putative membrane protein insertion efficiency factor
MSVATTEPTRAERGPAPEARGLGAALLLRVVHWYQALRAGRPTGCRYVPSCSEFAAEAITRHGAARGAFLAAGRVARCGPWGGHGIDPVPERRAR